MTQLSDLEVDIQTKLMRATFLNNLAVFTKHMPEVAKFYQNYTPSRAKLTFDHNGEINMVSGGSLVYEEKAKESSYKQAELFFYEPQSFTYNLKFSENEVYFEHERVLRSIYSKREADIEESQFNMLEIEKSIDFLMMIGVGLGFHIERLFQICDLRLFYLYEPDPDCFYCALHCIDFGPIIERCEANGGAFTLKLGGNANQFVNEANDVLARQGYFNVARYYNYRHYRSIDTDKTFDKIHELAYRLAGGGGFFEDEIISIIHTLTNSKEKYPLLKNKNMYNNALEDTPVFIIGNGPSLDETIDFVKENNNNAIVFSCGTALKPILDAGITPDFHIEMERTAALYQWVDSVGHKDKLKNINIIALNTVSTDILKLFKNAYLLPKPKDGGMDFLYEFIDEQAYPPVYACNPTVTNAASAAAAYMGFTSLYLFGVDYGYIDEEHHHSKGSIYYQKGSLADKGKMRSDMKVAGNFVNEVHTTQHFDSSRSALEMLLEKMPELSCYNCSNGAKIQLTIPQRYQDIPKLSKINNKEEKVELLLTDAFSFNELELLDLEYLFKDKLPLIKSAINQLIDITSVEVKSRKELTQLFSEQYQFIKNFKVQKDTKVVYRFLRGTLNYYQTNIMKNAYCYFDKNKQKQFINSALALFHEHLLWLFEELNESYNKPSKI
jgi:hypothetical protein